jgi:hypothetical protein
MPINLQSPQADLAPVADKITIKPTAYALSPYPKTAKVQIVPP